MEYSRKSLTGFSEIIKTSNYNLINTVARYFLNIKNKNVFQFANKKTIRTVSRQTQQHTCEELQR